MTYREAGAEAARHIWFNWRKPTYVKPEDPFFPEFSEGALQEFERLQEEAPGLLHAMADGAQKGAQQLNLDDYHGVMEVIQNADDLFANEVAVSIRVGPTGAQELLIVHDGEPVSIHHVLAMNYAFISTKVDDPKQKGKFGVGLKTLGRIADRMEVHSCTYSFAIENQRIKRVDVCPVIDGLYTPGKRSTLICLRLFDSFEKEKFIEWFSSLDASVLLFLDTVSTFRFVPSGGYGSDIVHILDRAPTETTIFAAKDNNEFGAVTARRYWDKVTGREWEKFQVKVDVPKSVGRSHKQTGKDTILGLALPKAQGRQKIYAGLPTYIRTDLPFSLDAQFDPDTSREKLLNTPWNKWLVQKLADLFAMVAVGLAKRNPSRVWALIPLDDEMDFEDAVLEANFADAFNEALVRVENELRFIISGRDVPLANISYEVEALEGLLDGEDYTCLYPKTVGLPEKIRDKSGRWRKVVNELNCSQEITVSDAFRLFENNEICQRKSPQWFVDILLAAINAKSIEPVFVSKCLLMVDGLRTAAQDPDSNTELIVKDNQLGSLARFNLTQILHPIYFSNTSSDLITKFLLEETNFSISSTPLELLNVFINRHENSPVLLSDEELVEVKALYDQIFAPDPEVGFRLGRSILVDAYEWKRGKKSAQVAPIASCYLPVGIVKDKAGQWAVAAAKTSGLYWVASRYALVLRGSRRGRNIDDEEQTQKILGPGKFFRALGAEIAPRLKSLSSKRKLGRNIPLLQRYAITNFQNAPSDIEDDFVSPDLESVVASICSSGKKSERRTRGLALFEAISFSWDRLYSDYEQCSASYYYYVWRSSGKMPATWLAHLAEQEWLTNLKNEPKAPKDLVIRTTATQAVYGDTPRLFAAELTEKHCDTGFPAALRMESNPSASGIVEQIQRMRDGIDGLDKTRLIKLYDALAQIAKNLKKPVMGSSAFGNLKLSQLRQKFGAGDKDGLLHVDGEWISPDRAFWGRDIFHGRRHFVPAKKSLEPLWRALSIPQPDFDACLKVLYEIARQQSLSDRDEAILIDTYRQLNASLGALNQARRKRLSQLPLWCHGQWKKARPIYFVANKELGKQLAKNFSVWAPPCSIGGMPKLLEVLKVRIVDDQELSVAGIGSLDEMVGEMERPRFMKTVSAVQEYFARTDEQIYKSLQVGWESLKQAPLFISDHLAIETASPNLPKTRADVRAHCTLAPLAFYFRSVEDIGIKEAGGRVVAECFSEACREQVAVTWVWKWQEAIRGDAHSLVLAEEKNDDQDDEILDAAGKSSGKQSRYERGRSKSKVDARNKDEDTKLRTLKDFTLLATASIQTVNPDATDGGYKKSTGRGLRKDAPSAPSAGKSSSGASTSNQGRIAYTAEELEEKALRCLHHVLRHGSLGELKDFTKFRGIGADAAIDLKKWFEIKASAREMPDRVELTLNEMDCAKLNADSFYLVVVAGLEEGYETILNIYKNPLRTLDWTPSRSIVVSGLKTKQALQIKLGVDTPVTETAPPPTSSEAPQ